MSQPHMIQQIIKYSDGTETVINYRGVIVDGVLTLNEDIKMADEEEAVAEEAAETPAEEASEEAAEEAVSDEEESEEDGE